MQQPWLKTNRRILLLGMILPAVLVVVGLIVVGAKPLGADAWLQILGWTLLVGGVLLGAILALQLRLPRLASSDDALLVYLQAGPPLRVPLEVVECIFLGTGAGQVPGKSGNELKVRNLVIRIAEKAADFQQRTVKPALGRWEEGYITIYGAWCEPLDVGLVNGLNAKLAEAKERNKGRTGEGDSG